LAGFQRRHAAGAGFSGRIATYIEIGRLNYAVGPSMHQNPARPHQKGGCNRTSVDDEQRNIQLSPTSIVGAG
jgi:hypothetical protein